MALYFYVSFVLQEEVDEELYSTAAGVESALLNDSLTYSFPPIVEIQRIDTLGAEILKDTILYDPWEDDLEDFRELAQYRNINGTNYKITVRKFTLDSDDILIAVMISYLTILALVFLFLFYSNRSENKKLWLPFFTNLEKIKQFSLASEAQIDLVASDILEFSELNKEIDTLTEKVRADYHNLKQFTENVSHEIQTPLALIQAKIENIINSNNLNDLQFEDLTSIQKDIHRLTQMNKRLTLLTKIENRQYKNPEVLDINQIIQKRIHIFIELFDADIAYSETDIIKVTMDLYLADILCDNLLSNAVKHNWKKSRIHVHMEGGTLSISNSGKSALKHPEKLFSRFYRESTRIKSTGLGLAIVRKICDYYGFDKSYEFKKSKHTFKIIFL